VTDPPAAFAAPASVRSARDLGWRRVLVVGSANVDIRSWRLNFELGALVADPAFARDLEERFVRDLAWSREVTLEEVDRRPWRTRFALGVARLLSPIL